ncbi:unnamed protein product [Meloidogyne enterolobii]|uniref:Uncharacterized protein n=1 Tax=Meloidogyne enterolobii TaxID=390850 RepID=A0ACB0Z4I1_MELEN
MSSSISRKNQLEGIVCWIETHFRKKSYRILAQVREISNRIIQPIIQDSTQNIANWQKQRLNELKQPLKHIYDFAISFIDSKEEVVKNISQRFSTWVRQAYERLDRANKKLVVFEEKYSGLRQRLDLVRQIKEAPNIYMLAVPEVIRREELRKVNFKLILALFPTPFYHLELSCSGSDLVVGVARGTW